ncbi:hypothetical protein Eta_0022 [Serratia phage Eta]|uniref:Phage-related protein n=1 Tax=Serratia phage Eta TaxID=1282995 RepID=R9VWB9_9CAUD|nr:hypothetical protein Eta_0022 [Serratia phage Eta]AGN89468.1 hypothetical protein Eta_0022 [Serratia phage Eta]
MKERPVIFNSEMVRAILDGRKTQTRRAINWKRQPYMEMAERDDGSLWPWAEDGERGGDIWFSCPFGEVGDRLWVRETWGVVSHDFDENERIIDWVPDRPATAIHEMPFGNGYYSGHAIYAADGEFIWGDDDGHGERSCWKPSIHMPRKACRILLEITAVRVERLNDISESDARAEGVMPTPGAAERLVGGKLAFAELWASIYGHENWRANPWVWVIEFRRVEVRDASK